MDVGIIREAFNMAISALQAQELSNNSPKLDKENGDLQPTCNQLATDTISRQASCDYCHEDSDGYVTPLEKNCHAFVRRSPIDGWVLSVKYGAWRKDISIRFCPICGRELKHE